jgi:hypothetical protein
VFFSYGTGLDSSSPKQKIPLKPGQARIKGRSRQIFRRWNWAGLLLLMPSFSWAAAWQANVTKDPPGNFPEVRSLKALYNFGWAGLTAATASGRLFKLNDRFELDGTGRTVGLARALWRYDVTYHSVTDATTLRPIETKQNETVRSKKSATHLTFSNDKIERERTEGSGAGVTKTKQFNLPGVFDLLSSYLYLRSQPLRDKSVYRVVVFPESAAYLATLTVLGREKISVHAGSFNAIKADLQLSKVGKNNELEPHRKFRRATIWISDDNDRIVLRIEAQIFIGTVFAELQSLYPDTPKTKPE